jgi:amidohydrolase
MTLIDDIALTEQDFIQLRRDLHAHPEIGFEEHRTSEIVAQHLAAYGCEVHRGVGGTGVVGVLRQGNGAGRVGLRADMDALPIHEATDLPYRSQTAGVMHACGHDGHTTMLLSAARYLAETRRFDGTVHFIFQPAEEGVGGARAMLKDGLFERFPCDAVFGMHNAPGIPIGEFAIRPGPMMAGGAFFDITVTGRGSHGARPEDGIDPVLAAAHITTALQAIVARTLSPADTAVISATAIHAGDAYNVIPQQAFIRGTARAFSDTVMTQIEQAMRRTIEGVAAGLGAQAQLDFRHIFAPLVNEPANTTLIADVAAELVGETKVNRARAPLMGSEDFSFMLQACPGAYINIGNGAEGHGSVPVHNPQYEFNDAALTLGAGLYAGLVERRLPRLTA